MRTECTLRGTLTGPYVAGGGEVEATAHYCEKAGMYIFIGHDSSHFKMTGVSLEDAKASSTPKSPIDKYFTLPKTSLDMKDPAKVCDLWSHKETKGGHSAGIGYEVKNVQVTCGGLYCLVLLYATVIHTHTHRSTLRSKPK